MGRKKKYSATDFLRRDVNHAMIGGVCAGIAKYFEVDISIIRLIAVLLLLFGSGAGFFVYVICWIVIPEE